MFQDDLVEVVGRFFEGFFCGQGGGLRSFLVGFHWKRFRARRLHGHRVRSRRMGILGLRRALRPFNLCFEKPIEDPPNSLGLLLCVGIPIQLL